MGEVYLFSFLVKMYAPLRMLCLFVQDCDSICVVAMGATFFGAVTPVAALFDYRRKVLSKKGETDEGVQKFNSKRQIFRRKI